MKISARDIDHLVFALSDPALAASRLEQMGFTLTPDDSEPRCVCFAPHSDDIPSYLELAPGDAAAVSLAMNVAELEGEERSHTWETEYGDQLDVRTVVGETEGPLPWMPVRNETPDFFSEPEWIVHPNGALAIVAVHAVADDPRALALDLRVAWDGQSEEIFDGCNVVTTGTIELLLWSPAAYQLEYKSIEAMAPGQRPAIVGLTLAVERARPLQALLRANNVPFGVADGSRTVVAPEHVGGLMIEFIPQGGAEA